jgi:hypothetical protein
VAVRSLPHPILNNREQSAILLGFLEERAEMFIAPIGKLFRFTKICTNPKLTIAFSGAEIYGVFSMVVYPLPQLLSMKSDANPLFSSSSYPQYWDFLHPSTKYPIVPRRRYSRDKMPPHLANLERSVLLGMLLPSCDGNQNYAPWELFAT